MMNKRLLALFLIGGVANAFFIQAPLAQRSKRSPFVACPALLATIYGPDGTLVTDLSDDDAKPSTPAATGPSGAAATGPSEETLGKLKELLSTQSIAKLARLAVAFAPLGHSPSLKDILEVGVMKLDPERIDIQAVICENDGCVTLAVPVEFPDPCAPSADLPQCVVDNLDKLDMDASEKIREHDWTEEHKDESLRNWLVLSSTDNVEYPEWWVFPKMIDESLVPECDSFRNLLNEQDFQGEILAMTIAAIGGNLNGWDMEQVAVTAVGPKGIMTRARLTFETGFGEKNKEHYSQIPVSFPAVAQDVTQLRELILGAVEAA